MEIKPFHLAEVKWPRPAPAEHNCLSTRFIDHPIAFEPARNGDRFALRRIGRNQFWIWPRAEPLRASDRVGRDELDDAQTIPAIGHERKLRRAHAPNLDRARVVERATRVEHLIEPRSLRIF